MKILHISRTMGQGGAEKVVYQLCKDCNIESFVASSGGAYVAQLKKIGIKHCKINDIANKNPFVFIYNLKILDKFVRQKGITIIHSHHRMAALYAQILKMRNKNLQLVYTAHNAFYDKKALLRFALRNTKIVACGESVKKNLVDYYGFPCEKIKVINNSVEIPNNIKEANIGKTKNSFNIGIIGRLTEQKGVDIFIKAFSYLDKNVHGFVVGDGELRNELTNLVKTMGLEKRITFLGYREDIFEIIKALDLIVSASRWEGFPLTPLEAFGCRKTIVASNIPGNNDIVRNKENGLLFRADNADDLADALTLITNNHLLRSSLEKQAKIDFNNKYKYNIFIEEYRRVYNEISRKN